METKLRIKGVTS